MSSEENPQGASSSSHKNAPRKRHPWWRAYDGLPTCSRWRVVARRARRPYPEVLSVVVYLLNDASVAKVRGDIQDVDAETCAAGLDMEPADVESILAALEATGWLAGGRIATWDDRQVAEEDSTAAERQANKRARDRAAKEQGVTASHGAITADHDRGEKRRPEETRPEQSCENQMIDSSAPSAETKKAVGQFFDDVLWPEYPKGKVHHSAQPARKAFLDLVFAGADPDEILAGVKAYAETVDLRYVVAPEKFLEEERWNEREPFRDREWDSNESGKVWIDLSGATEEERAASAARSVDVLVASLFNADGTPVKKRDGSRGMKPLPKGYGKPPIGWRLSSLPGPSFSADAA